MFKKLILAFYLVFSFNYCFSDIDSYEIRLQKLQEQVEQSFDPVSVEKFVRTTHEWLLYHYNEEGFQLQKLVKALDLLISKEIERQGRNGETEFPHIMNIIDIQWTEGEVRSVNVLVSSLLDHIDEVGINGEDILSKFGPRVYYTLVCEDHGPTQTEEQHRQAHLDIAPTQTINAQINQLAHLIERLRTTDFSQLTSEQIEERLEYNKQMLKALHGANNGLETVLKSEISQHLLGANS